MNTQWANLKLIQIGRADPTFPEAYRVQALQMPPLLKVFLKKWPFIAPYEKTLVATGQPGYNLYGVVNIQQNCAFDYKSSPG